MDYTLFIEILKDVGFPIFAAGMLGFFIYLIVKYMLKSVIYQVNHILNIITGLHKRISAMNNDVVRLDVTLSNILDMKIDLDRIERGDNKNARRD
jgi:hypothetical protein